MGLKINNLPAEHWKHKSKTFIATLNCYNPDAVALQEVGLNHYALEAYDIMKEQIRFLHDGSVTYAHNKWEGMLQKYQPGGTMIITTNEATHRTLASSVDPLHLGRWATTLLTGKASRHVCLVSVHNPIETSTGPSTVNQQHSRRLRDRPLPLSTRRSARRP